jgi:protoheme IX farnesyltransferase
MLVHVFAIATAIATFLLILIGGLVHGTGSSLACPDWPTCYGTFFPKMEGGVLVEHSHRLAAGTVMVGTIILLVLVSRSRLPSHRRLRPIAWLALALVLLQALLGGITVMLRLPTPVSTLHTSVSLLFFMTMLYLAVRSRPPRPAAAPPLPMLPERTVRLALVSAVAVYFQMVLGGLVRHSGAALACVDLPLCRGAVWPDAHPTVLIHVLHRLNALAVAALVIASSIATLRAARGRPGLRALAVVAPLLVLTQIALGVVAVLSFLDLVTVESHLGVATALLATQLLVVLRGRQPSLAELASEATTPLGHLRWAADLVRLTKPRITGLVIATFAGGMWLAPGALPRWRIIMTVIGTALVVGASNTINMFLERDADKLMDRTRDRPLPEGRVSPEAALALGTALVCASLPLLFLAGNALTGILAGVAFFSYVGVYTPLKRHSGTALFVGAVPGAIPPLMGWTAVTGRLGAPGLVLFAILFLWQIPHFLAIALYRAADYERAGFRTLPLETSERATRVHILFFSVVLVVATVLLEPLHVAGTVYAVAAVALGALLVGWGLAGFRRAASRAWARSLFLFSIVYLTLLFVALIVDRTSA